MATARIVLVVALLAAGCTSTSTKVEHTWQQYEQRKTEVIERWEKAPLDDATRRAHAMPDANPVAQIAWISVAAGLAYTLEDLAALERALAALEATDAEIAALTAR